MRGLAFLLSIAAALAGSVAAFAAMQAVGPENRTGEFGFGAAATEPPGGGTLFETRNFARIVEALERELGPEGAIQSLSLKADGASAYTRRDGRAFFVQIDAAGRSESRAGDPTNDPAALIPVARIDPKAIDVLVRGVREENRAPIGDMTLSGGTREWGVRMSEGEPDHLIANLDGRGVRLPGEPNPAPIGAAPDSLLRARNLAPVLAAARREIGNGGRVSAVDIRPDRVGLEIDKGSRRLRLNYGYDAQLTGRDISAATGVRQSVPFDALDPAAVERMARGARRVAGARGLGDVQYVLLQHVGLFDGEPGLLLYLPQGSDPPYVVADLHGRRVRSP